MTKRKRRQRSKRIPVRVRERADGRTVLEVDGVVQSILVQPEDDASAGSELGYWAAMLPPDAAPPPRRALLLGLGGGTVAALLARRFPDIAMVGIESDAGVLALARRDMGLDAVPGLTVVCADAFAWVAAAAESEPGGYEYIALDLYLAGRLVAGALARDFLRQVAALLTPAGLLAVNLMVTARTNDHVLRLQQVFYVTRVRQVSGNIVAHLRRADG
jgi:spermidine synthase